MLKKKHKKFLFQSYLIWLYKWNRHSCPSVKNVMEVQEWAYIRTEKTHFLKRGLLFFYPRRPPPLARLVKDQTFFPIFLSGTFPYQLTVARVHQQSWAVAVTKPIPVVVALRLIMITRAVESGSREVGKSLKIGKNRIKSEKSDLISY